MVSKGLKHKSGILIGLIILLCNIYSTHKSMYVILLKKIISYLTVSEDEILHTNDNNYYF